ncbi:MAG TPA: hypothetical protein VH328_08620, partial [Burkholderiaceae bacterium]|nr:hypothetical protein [Burkholderiaceae bacterium]
MTTATAATRVRSTAQAQVAHQPAPLVTTPSRNPLKRLRDKARVAIQNASNQFGSVISKARGKEPR